MSTRLKRSTRQRVATAVSAGGVVYRLTEGHVQIAICGRTDSGLWALPKGTPAPGESTEQTAVRETQEETGLQVTLVRPLGTIDYWFAARNVRYHKYVHFFLMKAVGGDTAQHDQEYDEVRWVEIDEALSRLGYPNEAAIVRQAAAQLAADAPRPT